MPSRVSPVGRFECTSKLISHPPYAVLVYRARPLFRPMTFTYSILLHVDRVGKGRQAKDLA